MHRILLIALLATVTSFVGPTPEATSRPTTAPNISLQRAEDLEDRILAVFDHARRCTVSVLRRTRRSETSGCGVLVDDGHYVVTAAHVVGRPDETVRLTLHDGRTLTGTTLGSDRSGDYGLIEVDRPEGLFGAEFGHSGELADNELCLLFGHPDGMKENRPAVARLGTYLGTRDDGFLRTSCVMMPGDSGGAIFDLEGRVIGINSHINRRLDANYHAPIDAARANWERLLDGQVWGRLNPRNDSQFENAARDDDKPTVLPGGMSRLHRALEDQYEHLRAHVVTVQSRVKGRTRTVGATVVGEGGLVLSKSSRVSDEALRCRAFDEWVGAEIVGRDQKNDLVLLRVDADSLQPVTLDTTIEFAQGSILWSMGSRGQVRRCGVVGAPELTIPKARWGMLGVRFDDRYRGEGVEVMSAADDGPAAIGGIRPGDRILEFDGEPVDSIPEVHDYMRTTLPGQKVGLTVARGRRDTELSLLVELGSSNDLNETMGMRMPGQEHIGYTAPRSERRGDFHAAFRHDMPLNLSECGLPLFDLEGHFVGINIAREDRTGSLALPVHALLTSLESLSLPID